MTTESAKVSSAPSDVVIHTTAVQGHSTRTAGRSSGTGDNGGYIELARSVRSAGLLRRRYGYYWTRLIAIPFVFAIFLTIFIWIGDSWWQVISAAVLAVLFTQIAFLGHDAAHRQIFRSGKWNEWVTIILGDLFTGMSYGWWQDKHTRHHENPNKEDVDPDIDLPVVAFTPAQTERYRSPLARWYLFHQGWFFFPILFLEGLSLHMSSLKRVLGKKPIPRRWVEIVFLVVRLGGYLGLVFIVLSPGIAVAFLAIQLGLFGFYMGMAFAPNHKGMPLVHKDATLDFLSRQVLMSRNIRGNPVVDTAMGGLNYQIEHHLFPTMPRPHLRKAAPMVAAFCKQHDVSYTETGLWESYGIVFRYINSVGLRDKDPFVCPMMAQRKAL